MATKDYSTKQENQVANYLGWKTVSASGAREFDKGDIISDDWLGECKTHTDSDKKIIFRKSVWDKIQKEADAKMKHPVLITDDGSQKLDRSWVLFRRIDVPEDAVCAILPVIIEKNIVFDNAVLKKKYEEDKKYYKTDFLIYTSMRFDTDIAICPLNVFQEIIGYY